MCIKLFINKIYNKDFILFKTDMRFKFCSFLFLFCLSFMSRGYAESKPALAVFVSNPQTRAVKTRLAQGLSSQELAEAFYEHCLNILTEDLNLLTQDFTIYICPSKKEDQTWARTRWPNFSVLPQCQSSNLGQRIRSTLNILQQTYDQVFIIGSDAPTLPLAYIRECSQLLHTSDAVFGPAEDGGYYLLGVRKLLPDITSVRWSTEFALEDTSALLKSHHFSVTLGSIWYDVDCVEDFIKLNKDLENSKGARQQLKEWLSHLPVLLNNSSVL